jgi:hypothetical protein
MTAGRDRSCSDDHRHECPPPPQFTLVAPADRIVEAGNSTGDRTAVAPAPARRRDRGPQGELARRLRPFGRHVDGRRACGGQASAVQTITVVDAGLIEIVVPGDVTVDCRYSCGRERRPLTSMPSMLPHGRYSDAATLDPCSGAGRILRVDSNGLVRKPISETQTITVTGSCAARDHLETLPGTGASRTTDRVAQPRR